MAADQSPHEHTDGMSVSPATAAGNIRLRPVPVRACGISWETPQIGGEMTWFVTGFENRRGLVFEYDLKEIAEADLAVVLGLEDVRSYGGGEYPIVSEGLAILVQRYGLSFEPGVEYFIGYIRDYAGQVRYSTRPETGI
jgi:hypothetical protein